MCTAMPAGLRCRQAIRGSAKLTPSERVMRVVREIRGESSDIAKRIRAPDIPRPSDDKSQATVDSTSSKAKQTPATPDKSKGL